MPAGLLEVAASFLQHLHAQIGGAQAAGHAQKVLRLRRHPALVGQERGLAGGRQADEQAVIGRLQVQVHGLEAMLLRRHRDACPELLDLLQVQFGRDSQDDIQQFRVRKCGIQLTHDAHYTLVSQVLQREVNEIEVNPFQVHPRGRMHFPALFGAVRKTGDGMISREAIELVYRLYFSDVRKTFGHT